MNRTSQSSQLNRNKMTTLPVSNLVKSRLEAASKNLSSNKKLRTELRRVMSDRVMKITKCSQQQTVEKINQLKISSPLLTAPKANLTPQAVLSNNLNLANKTLSLVNGSSDTLVTKSINQEKKQETALETNKSVVLQTISNFNSFFFTKLKIYQRKLLMNLFCIS